MCVSQFWTEHVHASTATPDLCVADAVKAGSPLSKPTLEELCEKFGRVYIVTSYPGLSMSTLLESIKERIEALERKVAGR